MFRKYSKRGKIVISSKVVFFANLFRLFLQSDPPISSFLDCPCHVIESKTRKSKIDRTRVYLDVYVSLSLSLSLSLSVCVKATPATMNSSRSTGRFKGQHIKAYVMPSRVEDDTEASFLSFG